MLKCCSFCYKNNVQLLDKVFFCLLTNYTIDLLLLTFNTNKVYIKFLVSKKNQISIAVLFLNRAFLEKL